MAAVRHGILTDFGPRLIWPCRSDQIWFSSYFFEKLSPGLKNGPESCPLRFSTISTKNHLLKLNIDKIMAIRVPQMPLPGYPPL